MLLQRSIEYVYICAYTVRSLSISIELSVYEMRRRHLKGIFYMEIKAARETGKKKKEMETHCFCVTTTENDGLRTVCIHNKTSTTNGVHKQYNWKWENGK